MSEALIYTIGMYSPVLAIGKKKKSVWDFLEVTNVSTLNSTLYNLLIEVKFNKTNAIIYINGHLNLCSIEGALSYVVKRQQLGDIYSSQSKHHNHN